VTAATRAEGADILHRYLEAGFDGFTFRNLVVRTPEDVARLGEVIGTLRKEEVPA
jgi:hypothetical protein